MINCHNLIIIIIILMLFNQGKIIASVKKAVFQLCPESTINNTIKVPILTYIHNKITMSVSTLYSALGKLFHMAVPLRGGSRGWDLRAEAPPPPPPPPFTFRLYLINMLRIIIKFCLSILCMITNNTNTHKPTL